MGALLCDAILRHSSTERILVVCYTNHALDSFLESLIAKGITSIVRVGGRSKNEVGMHAGDRRYVSMYGCFRSSLWRL